MILGMSIQAFIHTAISVVAIAAGIVVVADLMRGRIREAWTAWFIVLTVVTSATGLVLPAAKFLPSHGVAIIALLILIAVITAKYARVLSGGWRLVYVVGAVASLYLNVFVLIIQLFGKVPALKALAPTQSELPFAVLQGATLLAFIAIGFLAVRRRSLMSRVFG